MCPDIDIETSNPRPAGGDNHLCEPSLLARMCMYCTFREDGWTALLDYDDVYQEAIAAPRAKETNYGFYEEWDDLREQVTPGTGR